MRISIRKFTEKDILNKIKWINDPKNNKFLHYDLPLVYEKTLMWFNNNKDRTDRYDAIIEADGMPVGLIGLIGIDEKNRKAEFYVALGEQEYKGKGVAVRATKLLLDYAFNTLMLNKIYLYTEKDNITAQRLFERLGFSKEGFFEEDLIYNNRKVDRFCYGIVAEKYASFTIDNSSAEY